MESYPGNCFTGITSGAYARMHNPFISFDYIRNNATLCEKIAKSTEIDIDLNTGRLPQYSFFTPDVNSDGHDTSISFAGLYLKNFFATRLSKFPANTLILITFDEDRFEENNRIYSVLLGSMITPGSIDNTRYNHYSQIRTIQENWGLASLNRQDVSANPFTLPLQTITKGPTFKSFVPISRPPPSPPDSTYQIPPYAYAFGVAVICVILLLVGGLILYPPLKEAIDRYQAGTAGEDLIPEEAGNGDGPKDEEKVEMDSSSESAEPKVSKSEDSN